MNNHFLVLLHLAAGAIASVLTYPARVGTSEETFVGRFGAERLFVIGLKARELLDKASGCIACGRCEMHAAGSGAPGVPFPVNSADVILHTRSINEADLLSERVKEMKRFDLGAMERGCPAGVPFSEILTLVEELIDRNAPPEP
jgi:hypothetical protein